MRDHLGIYYDKTSDFQQEQFNALRQLIDDTVPHRPDIKTLLDIGAGTGSRTLQCLDIFPHVDKITAIEPDWEMIAVAKEKYASPRIDYLQMGGEDIAKLGEQHLVFDGIISNWSLHWVSGKDQLMQNINSLTRPGATFMFSTCEALPTILTMIDRYIRDEFRIQNASSPFFYLNAKEWEDLLNQHGWYLTGKKTYRVNREEESAKKYVNAWFAASTTKFMYGKHLVELPALSHSDLIWMMQRAFPSRRHENGIAFSEDVMFITARKK